MALTLTTDDLNAIAHAVWDALTASYDDVSGFGAMMAAIDAKVASITAGSVTFTGPVLTSDEVEVVQGADYADADDMALAWSDTDWPTLTGATVYLVLKEGLSGVDETYTMTVTSASAIRIEFTNAQTDLMDEGTHDFWIIAYLNTTPVRRVALVRGMWTVTVPPEVSP